MSERFPSALAVFGIGWMLVAIALGGCTTKAKADAQSRAAFMAGRQQALARTQQPHDPVVTVIGKVRNPAIPWTEELTLANAIVAAGYSGFKSPRMILITRNGQQIQVDPRRLLSGADVPLEAGDVVEIQE